MSISSRPGSEAPAQSQNLPSPGQEALLHACLGPAELFGQHWRIWRDAEDIEHLDESSNRLLPLLFKQAEKAGWVDHEMGRLRGIYRYQWCRNQMMLAELRRVVHALNLASTEVMLLKGAAMIQAYYEDPALRPMSDLDIMVRPDDFEKASQILRELGYTQRFSVDFAKIRSERLTHAIEFTRTIHGQTWEIDLHWTPLHRATWPGAEESFWQHARAVTFKGEACRTFDATHQLLHVCLHGALWNALPPMRWITDAMWILRKDDIDWARLMAHARALNGLQLLKNSLEYIHSRFDAPIPRPILKQLDELNPSRFERLEFSLLTSSSSDMRIDQLLMLGWFNHSRALHGMPLWQRVASFPNYLKTACKLSYWREAPGYVIRRILARG
ncbi:nucleotidyltransferase domain-containing protein [Ottowia thiooxydans]|uniref:Nucleotidyltransferase family protein n=1 Tax=Ottowia thiooxydans TaxID=219182 RepID=A0ABV2QDP2_9BURK